METTKLEVLKFSQLVVDDISVSSEHPLKKVLEHHSKMPPPRSRTRAHERLEPAPEPQTQFQFPRMPLAEIQEDMNLFNCPITREVLKAPTATDVKGVLDFFIKEISDKRHEEMGQAAFGCLDNVDYPELYDDAIPRLHYLRECQKIFGDAQFEEFGIRDVFAPSKSRFNWQISALINYNKFRQNRLESFEEMAKNADDLLDRERAVVAEKSDLQREITAIENVRASEKAEVETTQDIVAELTLEIHALHKQQRTLTDQIREAKLVLTDKHEKAMALKARKMAERGIVDEMRSRVVSSPDRVKGELNDMRESLQSEKALVAEMEKRIGILRKRSEGLSKADGSVKEAMAAAEECIAVKQRLEQLKQTVQENQTKKSAHEMEVESIKESKEHHDRLVESVVAKVSRIDEQCGEIDSNTSESDMKLATENQQLEIEREEVNRLLEGKESSIQSVQKEIESCATNVSDVVGEVQKKHKNVCNGFTSFHDYLLKAAFVVGEAAEQSLEGCHKLLRDRKALKLLT